MYAKIAVSAATYWIDKPYDYHIPLELENYVVPGIRVKVPFSRGNRITIGIVLAVSNFSSYDTVKDIVDILDNEPILSEYQLKLSLWMRERYFCTVFDAVKSIIPSGLWYDQKGKRKVSDKHETYVSLSISNEEAQNIIIAKKKKAPRQADILETLTIVSEIPINELLNYTGANRQSLAKLSEYGYIKMTQIECFRRSESYDNILKNTPPDLNESQSSIFNSIINEINSNQYNVSLINGVTGSGKTIIYIHLIEYILEQKKSALLLVPEISLTPQMLKTFSLYFGNEIAVLHSALSSGERYDEWKRIKQGKAHVVIGTRSAIFAPIESLGLIIIDEEQESTYKSENNPRYDAKEIAKYICFKNKIPLILGSATPDIQTMYFAQTGVYKYYELSDRYNNMDLPLVHIVDMKDELKNGNGTELSNTLIQELNKNINNGEQSILFLNRRGRNKLVTCCECGFTYSCPNCSVNLTYHSDKKRLICHYCGYTKKIDSTCPGCGGSFNFVGCGTQKIEEQLNLVFPNVDLIRLDADTVKKVGSHKELLNKFTNSKIPIMIGTQMITKGLNFENVTLVGIISADQSLYSNDYRANETTFSLLTQVIGRSGRGTKKGRAIIQTYTPDNETIKLAAKQDYLSFYNSEIELRKLQKTPPFYDLLSLTLTGYNEPDVVTACNIVEYMLKDAFKGRDSIDLLGISPLNVVMVNKRYRYRIFFKCVIDKYVRQIISAIIIKCKTMDEFKDISIYAENNPIE